MKDLKDKIVLITGGASGIGKAVALRFAREGARVVLWDVNGDALARTVEEVKAAGGQAHGYRVDVTDAAKVYEAAETVRREVGEVDVLDNNAGVVFGGDFLDVQDEKTLKTMGVNVNSYFWCLKAFLPAMLRRDSGHVVMMASAAGMLGVPGMAAYCSSKHAVVGLADSLRLELRCYARAGQGALSARGLRLGCRAGARQGAFSRLGIGGCSAAGGRRGAPSRGRRLRGGLVDSLGRGALPRLALLGLPGGWDAQGALGRIGERIPRIDSLLHLAGHELPTPDDGVGAATRRYARPFCSRGAGAGAWLGRGAHRALLWRL